jgi:hypothetical protein
LAIYHTQYSIFPSFHLTLIPKLSAFPTAIIIFASQFSGGDKPHPYLFGETSFVVAGFIPAAIIPFDV